jgi:hypothetical protein
MSENIQSIANGSFVLGQTSATTYQAGPGISITQPSEGTVRISNDETVLFQNGTVATKSATLSEPITNFNKIGVLLGDDHYGHRYVETYTSYPFAKWIANYGFDAFNTGSNAIGFRELAWSANGNKIYSVVGWQKSTVLTATGSWNAGQSGTYGGIIKVIGINRISGGNA